MAPSRNGITGHAGALAKAAGALALAALGLLMLAGCGSVGDVGTGASRSGVQPVRGVYGYSSQRGGSPQETQKRVEVLARANRKAAKKDVAQSRAIKASADTTSEVTPDEVASLRAPLDAEVKVAVIRAEREVVQPARTEYMARPSATGYRAQPSETDYYADEFE